MGLKIKQKVLKEFLRKAMMSGKQGISDAIFRFESDGLKINANSTPKQARVMAWLKKDAFKEYEEIDNIGLNDLQNVVKVVDRFGEIVSLKKEGNLLTISGDKKKVDIELVAENFLETDTGQPNLEFKEIFNISGKQISDVFSDVKMNADSVLTIETTPKKVKFKNTGKYKFVTEIEAPSCKGEAKSSFGEALLESVSALDGNLEISMGDNYPIKIMEKKDESVITIIVAPFVEEE